MEELRFRIKSALKQENLSVYALCKNDEKSRNTVNNQINRTTTISAETIMMVLDRIPTLSAEWLLRGRGRMFHNADPLSISITQTGGIGNTANTGTMTAPSSSATHHTDEEYAAIERENIQLRAQLELMKQLFTQKTL